MAKFTEHRTGPTSLKNLGVLLGAGLLAACQSKIVPHDGTMPGAGSTLTSTAGGTDSTSTAAATSTAGGVSTTGGANPPTDCEGSALAAPKRMVRLTFNQLANSVRSLFGDALADAVVETFEIGDLSDRDFPPLSSPREGALFIDA